MAYYGNAPADVALVVGQDVITTTEIQDATIATADIANDAITAIKVDDDGTGFQMGSLGLGGAVSGSEKLTVTGTASFSGDITGTLATASQGNITSVGTLTGLSSSDHIVLNNNKYFKVKDTAGSDIRVIGLANSNDVYVGFIDDATGTGNLYLRTSATNALTIDSSQNATFAGDVTLSANTSILHLGSRFRMKSDHSNATGWFGVGSSLNNFKFGDADFGSAIAEINLSANVTALQVIKDTGAYTGYFLNENGAGQGLHIKVKGNDSGQTGRYLIKAEGYGSSGAYTDNFLVDTDGNATFAGSIKYPNGTATAPALAFANDANTGVYSGGTDVFAITTAGSYRAEWDGNGKFYTGGHSSIGGSASAGRYVIFGGHYGIWTGYHYFTHDLDDRAIDLEWGVNNIWTSGEIILQGTYSYQNVSGWNKFAFTYNQNTTSDYGRGVSSFSTDSDIHQNNDDIFSVATSGNGSNSGGWDSSANKHKMAIKRAGDQGNGCWITVIVYREASAYLPNLSLGSEYSF